MEHPVVQGESSTSNSSTPEWKYDVFLSFAGKDTRLKFTDHLDAAFNKSGIKTFRDDVDLERGANIRQYLFQAIQESLCAVLIISENYADSTWCLEELQKILECQNTLHRRVFPIFYDVDPADVRHYRKSFGEAFAKHEKRFVENTEKVQNWKNVLSDIANLSGWDTRGMHEAHLIEVIVGEVWTYLSSKLPCYNHNLVGIESRVAHLVPLLEIGLDDKRFVGIWGMGGVGKTTLARVVFENISHKFDACCFLANVRETLQIEGLVSLQNRLLSHLKIKDMNMIRMFRYNKKVLLVLDDVDDVSQLKNLAESPDWFGEGSRIIITTRDSHLLTSCGVDEKRIYEMKPMKKDESLQLFSNKAFHKDCPEDNFLELSKSVVEYAGGLPLALEVLGSFLFTRSEAEWRDALDRLKQIPDDSILQVLKISYVGLNVEEKALFLDIACFFKGWMKKEVIQILKSCDLHPIIGIKVLIEKSLLVETEDCRLEMHALLENLGRHLVHEESSKVGQRSRLWELEDIKEVLENSTGSEAIQAIAMRYFSWEPDKIKVHPEAFSKMSHIRLLILNTMTASKLILPRGLKLSRALKVVRWPLFSLEALPIETPLDKLVHIQMRSSEIKQFWNGIQFMKNLKSIDLSYSCNFTETPDFSRVPYLEHLYLRDCTSLVNIHPSLGELKYLVEVYLNGCRNLEILPRKLETNSLLKLDLSSCRKVALLPKFGEGMKRLSYLDVSFTAITRLPESLTGTLTGLEHLNLTRCKILNVDELWKTHMSHQISSLNVTSLTELYLRDCGLNDGLIPDDLGSMSSLILLDLSENDFVNLPTGCFSGLSRLLFLSLDNCEKLKSLPRLPPRLSRLNAYRCDSMKPLREEQLWNLVVSLDHEYRGRTRYVISGEKCDDSLSKHVEIECLPMRDFCAIIPGDEIPSWFIPNEVDEDNMMRGAYKIKVDIPPDFHDNEWSGIVLCFLFKGYYFGTIHWATRPAENDGNWTAIQDRFLCIKVLELNEETWKHLRANNNSLHIKFSTIYQYSDRFGEEIIEMSGYGWRAICKNEIQDWCNHNHFNQLTDNVPLKANIETKISKYGLAMLIPEWRQALVTNRVLSMHLFYTFEPMSNSSFNHIMLYIRIC